MFNDEALPADGDESRAPYSCIRLFIGLWLPVWIFKALAYSAAWRCSFCGFSDQVKYLSNPRLRAYEQQQARERLRVRAQMQIDRGDVTFQERIAYFISDNKAVLIFGGVGCGILGTLIVLSALIQNRPGPAAVSSTATTQPKKDEAGSKSRREFAKEAQIKYGKSVKNITVTTAGVEDKLLFIHSKAITEQFVNVLRKSDLDRLKELGFINVRVENGKESWTLLP